MAGSNLSGKLPESLSPGLLHLGRELITQNQDALGWLCSTTRNVVTYSDPEERRRVQQNLDNAVALLSVAHIMGIFEKYFPINYWPAILDAEKIERLKAYRHIRTSAGDGFVGSRPAADKAEFDKVMASDKPLRGVTSYTDESMTLSPDIINDLCVLVRNIADMALVAASHP